MQQSLMHQLQFSAHRLGQERNPRQYRISSVAVRETKAPPPRETEPTLSQWEDNTLGHRWAIIFNQEHDADF
jgi:hypothetical protein